MARFGIVFIGLLCGAAYAQTKDGQPAFEVASIKPAGPPEAFGQRMIFGSKGGPGTNDPGRYQCNSCDLQFLITRAYGLEPYQLSIPSSMDARFEITAKVPVGATEDQLKLMLQNLLADRFKLKIHRETRDGQIYELTVAKGGSKMKEAAPEPAKEPPKDPAKEAAADAPPPGPPPLPAMSGGKLALDKDGFPILPAGRAGGRGQSMIRMAGKARMQFARESMEDFAKQLERQLGKPVTDSTGLKGNYELTLIWDGADLGGRPGFARRGGMEIANNPNAPPPPSPGGAASDGGSPIGAVSEAAGVPTLFGALQSQLGLKLEAKKGRTEVVVVDHAEKVPTEN
jgi:uncharacterized protein (TIGR03435 family)